VHFTEYGTIRDETKDTALGFLRYYLTERMDALVISIGHGEIPQNNTPETTETSVTAWTTTEVITLQTETNTSFVTEQTDDSTSSTPIAVENQPNIAMIALIAVSILVVIGIVFILKKKK
jgi:carbohydrate-binding DOMON domain-containing protein